MSGEQLWDSLVSLNFKDIDSRRLQPKNSGYQDFERFSSMTGEGLLEELFSRINKTEKPKTNQKFGNPINIDCPIKPGRAIDPTLLALNENGETLAFCCKSCVEKFNSQKKQQDKNNFVKDRNSVRASELSSPAPVGHIVREFGGSDREQIENSNTDPSTTQVLNLINGFIETKVINNKNSEIVKLIKEQKTLDDKIKVGFKSILNRKPSIAELKLFKDALINKKDIYKEIIWALVNSHEYIFIK
jgi:hypothetical protein